MDCLAFVHIGKYRKTHCIRAALGTSAPLVFSKILY